MSVCLRKGVGCVLLWCLRCLANKRSKPYATGFFLFSPIFNYRYSAVSVGDRDVY